MAFSVNGIEVIDADGVLKVASGTTADSINQFLLMGA